VFPSPETDPFEESAIPTEASADIPVAFDMEEMGDADDLHAFAEPNGTAAAGSSHVEVGTGFSGIVSPSEIDPPSDGMAADEWPDADATEATLDDFATDDQPSFDASGFDGVSEAGDAVVPGELHTDDADLDVATVGAAAATAAVATAVRGRPAARKKGGGIGQVIGIVLGGLMAIPITYAILIWGLQKDPFKLPPAPDSSDSEHDYPDTLYILHDHPIPPSVQQYVMLSVHDCGIRIPSEIMDSLFKPHSQVYCSS
jgi:hypothetical protein